MSWTTTFSTGQVVTATDLNTLLPTVSQSVTAKGLNTVYQNTTSQIRVACVQIGLISSAGLIGVLIKIGSTSPPVNQYGLCTITTMAVGQSQGGSITFLIPPNYYYTATTAGATPSLSAWSEWNLF